jgi:penicillin-binding protein 1C
MAFDAGVITPKTKLADVPVHYDGYSPENFDRKFHGQVSAEDALSSSLNIPAVVLLEKITVPVFRQRLLDAGCYSLRQQPGLGLSTILGGCGNTLEELTTLYTCFAREGSYMPIRYTHGKIPATVKKKIISPTAAYILSSILTRRDRPDLPNLFESSLHVPRIAWKTGTSYGRRDAWAIGYNKRYTVGVWIGNFDGKGIPELTGADMATPLLFQVFNSIDYNSTQGWFQPTRELDYRYICPQSGRIPGEHCSEKIIDAYLPGVSSTEVCDHLAEFKTDPAEKISYCTHCLPETGYKRGIYENPPAEVLRYYREQGLPVKIPPPHNPLCTRLFEGNKPRILSLKEGEEYLLEKEDPRPLELSAAVSGDVTTITWFINDQFYKTIPAGDKCFFAPHAGNTKISCTDDKGRNADIRITVTMY